MTRPAGWREEAGQQAAAVERKLRASMGLTDDGSGYVLKYARHRLGLTAVDPLVPRKLNRPVVELLRERVDRELDKQVKPIPTAEQLNREEFARRAAARR
jgi:hypothetical protein